MSGSKSEEDKKLEEPLLLGESSHDAADDVIDYTEDTATWPEVKAEAKKITNLALQIALQSMCSYGMTFFSVAFVGRLGSFALSVSALATSMYNVTGLSILVGFNTALDTLCAQAYGAGNYEKVGVVLQRGTCIATIGFAVFAALYTQMELLLLWMGQEPDIAAAAARYMWIMVPGLAAAVSGDLLKRYLMAQTVVMPSMIATAIATALSPFFNWFFIYHLGWGLDGAAVAYDCAMITMTLLTFVAVGWHWVRLRGSPMQTWCGWSRRAFTGWGQYMGLATPATIMVCLEWWVSEVIIIFAGWLADPQMQVAVIGASVQLMYLLSRFALGLASGTSIRTANLLGANRAAMAKAAWHIGLICVIVVEVLLCAGTLLCRDLVGYLFTTDEKVISGISLLMPVTALAMFFDSVQCVIRAVLQGSGNQKIGAYLNAFSYWVIGVPACYVLGFPLGGGIYGLMGGFALASVLQGVFLFIIVTRMDFAEEGRKALVRVNASSVAGPQQMGDIFVEDLQLLRDTVVRAGSMCGPVHLGEISRAAALDRARSMTRRARSDAHTV